MLGLFVVLAVFFLVLVSLYLVGRGSHKVDYYGYLEHADYQNALREERERRARLAWTYGGYRY
jgi:hypothetical protein